MGVIIKNGIEYGGASSSSSNTGHREVTQAEYNALSEAERNSDTVFFITDAEDELGIITMSLESYNNLSEEEQNNGTYWIPDADLERNASTTEYDNSTSGLEATNVQSAIDEVNSNRVGFIDVSNILLAGHYVIAETTENYTAEADCYIIALIYSYSTVASGHVLIDGVVVSEINKTGADTVVQSQVVTFPIKKGQTVSVYSNKHFGSYFTIYGIC